MPLHAVTCRYVPLRAVTCRYMRHLQVRKVPGALRLMIHSDDHDHEAHLINASHLVNDFWLGAPPP